MTINVAIKGGLGNQLFQYALGSYLGKKYHTDVRYDVFPLGLEEENQTNRPFLLGSLFPGMLFTDAKVHELYHSQYDNTLKKLHKKLSRTAGKYKYIAETNPNGIALSKNTNYYLEGYWQRADTAQCILNDLNTLTESTLAGNVSYNQIRSSGESVALHVRRGDYISNAFVSRQHGHCDINYYLRAMARMEELVNVSDYFIFSDDLPWAKQHLTSTRNLVFVDGNVSAPVTDLFLMKSCRHQVIANSSFSCWAAYLNKDSLKKIIAPVNWTTKEKTAQLPLAEPTWMLI